MWPFSSGPSDEEKAAAANAAALDAAKQLIAKQSAQLESDYNAKYAAAQSQFEAQQSIFSSQVAAANSKIAEQQSGLDSYAGQLESRTGEITDVVQKFNSAGQEASVAATNNGTPKSYAVATQPLEDPGPSPLVIAIAALAAYFLFLKKGR